MYNWGEFWFHAGTFGENFGRMLVHLGRILAACWHTWGGFRFLGRILAAYLERILVAGENFGCMPGADLTGEDFGCLTGPD